jgi:hypothetical protein
LAGAGDSIALAHKILTVANAAVHSGQPYEPSLHAPGLATA